MTSNGSNPYQKLPLIAVASVVAAFLLCAVTLIAAARNLSYLVPALLPIAAGVAILRRRTWGAYGFGAVMLGQVLIIPVLFAGNSSASRAQIWVAASFWAGLGLLFLLTGQALSRAGATSGARWPWIAIALAFSVPFLFVRAYIMPSGSMENTLLIGDRMLVRVFPRPAFKEGDLIVFRYPLDHKQIFVKRVIGVPGDRIRMKDRILYRNGSTLVEPYAIHQFPPDVYRDNLPGDSTNNMFAKLPELLAARTAFLKRYVVNGEVVVPPRQYFVLGDNRDNSLDSRFWGFVSDTDAIGKPFLIYDSKAGTDLALGRIESTRTHTHWNRVFKLPFIRI